MKKHRKEPQRKEGVSERRIDIDLSDDRWIGNHIDATLPAIKALDLRRARDTARARDIVVTNATKK